MYLFFDTETTGKDKNRDHIVQIAWVLADADGNAISEQDLIVEPDGYEIPWGAARIHGITTAIARQRGEALSDVLEAFEEDALDAETLVAHNIDFDFGILRTAYRQVGEAFPFGGVTTVCTMKSTTQWCRLPYPSGRSGYKWPKLAELHQKLFGASFDGAHNARADVHACKRCYFALIERGVLVAPSWTGFNAAAAQPVPPSPPITQASPTPPSPPSPPQPQAPAKPQASRKPQASQTPQAPPKPLPSKSLIKQKDIDAFEETLIDVCRRVCLDSIAGAPDPADWDITHPQSSRLHLHADDIDAFGTGLLQLQYHIAIYALRILRKNPHGVGALPYFDENDANEEFGEDFVDLMIRIAFETLGDSDQFVSTAAFLASVRTVWAEDERRRKAELDAAKAGAFARRVAQLRIAADPSSSEDQLAACVKTADREIICCVAQNPAASTAILAVLLESVFAEDVASDVLAHKHCPESFWDSVISEITASGPANERLINDSRLVDERLLPCIRNPRISLEHLGRIYWRWFGNLVIRSELATDARFSRAGAVAALQLFDEVGFARDYARSSSTSPCILHYLGTHPSWVVKRYVAGNARTPQAVLAEFENLTDSAEIRRYDAATFATRSEKIRKGDLEDEYPAFGPCHVRAAALGNPNSPSREASDPQTPRHRLLSLAWFRQRTVQIALASNPRTPPELLNSLAKQRDAEVRAALARSPTTPTALLVTLFTDPEPAVQRALAKRDDLAEIRVRAEAERFARKRQLATDARTPLTALMDLRQDPDPVVRAAVAQAKNAPIFVVEQLCMDADARVRAAAAARSNLDAFLLRNLLFDASPEVRLAALTNPACTAKTLDWLTNALDRLTDSERRLLAGHKQAPAGLLSALAGSADASIRRQIANRDDCPEDAMKILAQDPFADIRRAVLKNPRCSAAVLEVLAQDEIREWRIFALRHRNCPGALVKQLMQDRDPEVRRAAAQRRVSTV